MPRLPVLRKFLSSLTSYDVCVHDRQRKVSYRSLDPAVELLEDRLLLTAGVGLHAQYFNNEDLTDLVVERLDAEVNFNWKNGSPDPAIDINTFSARWSGEIEAPFTETYQLSVIANNGARLWVNGQLLVDRFDVSGVVNESAAIDFVAGNRYDIQLEYRELSGKARVRLEWSSPSLPQEVIPTDRLFPTTRGQVSVERFNGIPGNTVQSLKRNAKFPDSPDVVSTLDSFEATPNVGNTLGQRIYGLLHAPETGVYRFYIAADQNAELWLSSSEDPRQRRRIAANPDKVSPRDWTVRPNQQSAEVILAAGQSYYVEALHKEAGGPDHLAVGWTRPGHAAIEVIDGKFLSPVVPTVRLFAESPVGGVGSAAPATFRVVRTNAADNNPLVVNYNVSGTATNGVDYAALPGTITIPAGSSSAVIAVVPTVDTEVEGDEQVNIELLSSVDYHVGRTSERSGLTTIQDDVETPAGGTSLFNGNALADFIAYGANYSTVSDPAFGNVIQADVTSVPPVFFNSQIGQAIDAPVLQGELLLAEFYVRSLGEVGEINVVFEVAGPPYTQSLGQGFAVGTDWQKIQIPFRSVEDYTTGAARFAFQIGQQIQTLQFADIQLTSFGTDRDLLDPAGFITNNIGGTFGASQNVSVAGPGFDTAIEIDTVTAPPESFQLQIFARNAASIRSGQNMRLQFWARGTAGSNPRVEAMVLRNSDFTATVFQAIDLTPAWQRYTLEVTVGEDFNENTLHLTFNAGFDPQTIQIGGIKWVNLDQPFSFTDLPRRFPSISYGGRSGDDPWRELADRRIRNQRAADLTVNVFDANGDPLDGAQVIVRQKEHAFLFGSALNGFDGRLDPNGSPESLKYQSEFLRLFNSATDEGATQWIPSTEDYPRAFIAANFADQNDLYFRGHSGIWPSRTWMPDSVWNQYDALVAAGDPTAAENYLRTEAATRIETIANDFAALTNEWDVVNEPRTNNDVMQILGDQVLVDWFSSFRTIDPGAKLSLNEFDIFSNNGNNADNLANFQYWLGLLSAQNLVDVVGEQSHYTESNLTDIAILGGLIDDLYDDFGIPITITELDVESKDEQLQADYLRDYLTTAFSRPGIEKITQWGFWEGRHWRPDAALYRTDFSIKPNGQAYEDLVYGSWWTDVHGTSVNGSLTENAFLGEYEIIVQYDGQQVVETYTHTGSAPSASINLPTDPINYSLSVSSDLPVVSGQVSTVINNSGTYDNFDQNAVSLTASFGTIVKEANGIWSWFYRPGRERDNLLVTITADDGQGRFVKTSFRLNVFSGNQNSLLAIAPPAPELNTASADQNDWLQFNTGENAGNGLLTLDGSDDLT